MRPAHTLPLLALLLVAAAQPAAATAPPVHDWSRNFGGSGRDFVYDSAVDPAGNTVVVGTFYDEMYVGSTQVNSAGNGDIFVVLLDPTGSPLWVRRFGDPDHQEARGVAVDATGAVYVTGFIHGSVDFGGGTLTSAGGSDAFLLKLDAGGSHVWSRRFGDSLTEEGTDVEIDAAGYAVMVGGFYGTIDLGGGTLTSAGDSDMFVARYKTSNGSIDWARRYGGTGFDYASQVGVDGSSFVYFGGILGSSTDFGGGVLIPNSWDMFLVRLDSKGNHDWSRVFNNAGTGGIKGLCVDSAGNMAVAGYFYNSVNMGGGILTSSGGSDAVVARYTGAGAYVEAKSYGDTGLDYGQGVALTATGEVYFAGFFEGKVNFGGSSFTSAGEEDAFVVKLDAGGAHVWSTTIGGDRTDYGFDVVSRGASGISLAGLFSGEVMIGGSTRLSATESMDVFVVGYDPSGVYQWARTFGGSGFDSGKDLAAMPDGGVVVTGYYHGTINFGGGGMTSAGSVDGFLVRLGSTGGHAWSLRFGDTESDAGDAVICDAAGNIYLLGHFRGTINLGGGDLVSATLTDVFLAKFNSAGTHVWSRAFPGAGSESGTDLVVDPAGYVLLTAHGDGPIDFGGGAISAGGSYDIYLAKLSAATGGHIWSHAYGGTGFDLSRGLDIDAAGNVTLVGLFEGTVDFGGGPFIALGIHDIFAAKYDAGGGHLWSHAYGDTDYEDIYGVAVDRFGNAVIVGYFDGTIDFGGGGMVSAGDWDVFLAKLDPAGGCLWSRSFGGSSLEYARSVDVDAVGNILLAGYQRESIDLGGGLLTGPGYDMFLAMYLPDGDHLWSRTYGGPYNDFANAAVMVGEAGVAMTGYFLDSIDFGGSTLLAGGGFDLFVAKFSPEATGIEAEAGPAARVLAATPNPFAMATRVVFELPAPARTKVTVHDVAGRLVRVLVDEALEAGAHAATWDGRDAARRSLPPGVYFLRVVAGGAPVTRKVVRIE